MGREMGGSFKKKGTYVYLWLIHVVVWQKPTKLCKAIIFQLKNKLIKKKENLRPCPVVWSGRACFNSLNWFVGLMSLEKKKVTPLVAVQRDGEPWAILGGLLRLVCARGWYLAFPVSQDMDGLLEYGLWDHTWGVHVGAWWNMHVSKS